MDYNVGGGGGMDVKLGAPNLQGKTSRLDDPQSWSGRDGE